MVKDLYLEEWVSPHDWKSLEELEEHLTGRIPEHHLCVDCGVNTHPGAPTKKEVAEGTWEAWQAGETWTGVLHFGDDTEVYMVRESVWGKAGMEPYGGCLCIGCLERRLGRKLKLRDPR